MTSIFELFKIGIGPSSSHTVGPMRAAREFSLLLRSEGWLDDTATIKVELFGSLALTGKGHATDSAVVLGLMGELPDSVDPSTIPSKLADVKQRHCLSVLGMHRIHFAYGDAVIFRSHYALPAHSNGMRFTACDRDGSVLCHKIYYSIGGGFIVADNPSENQPNQAPADLPYPYSSAAELLQLGRDNQKPIWGIVLENEKTMRAEDEIYDGIFRIWEAMKNCTHRGMRTEGVLEGGLNVRRRAPQLYEALARRSGSDPLSVIDCINVFAIAVCEENAAGGRVVTAPTNGAAGVMPAVGHYYEKFVPGASESGILRFFLTATAIGGLYKEHASISGAEVGCQGEVGVACSMAAGALVAAMGGTNEQVEHAAEIGMEHHLGMTCDPVGGLVQIPCIERNAIGAVKAVTAARLALSEAGAHNVSLDQVIRTMYQTGKDMQQKYKETSLGGLAVNIIEC
jgi:L-serine dehydratase